MFPSGTLVVFDTLLSELLPAFPCLVLVSEATSEGSVTFKVVILGGAVGMAVVSSAGVVLSEDVVGRTVGSLGNNI